MCVVLTILHRTIALHCIAHVISVRSKPKTGPNQHQQRHLSHMPIPFGTRAHSSPSTSVIGYLCSDIYSLMFQRQMRIGFECAAADADASPNVSICAPARRKGVRVRQPGGVSRSRRSLGADEGRIGRTGDGTGRAGRRRQRYGEKSTDRT